MLRLKVEIALKSKNWTVFVRCGNKPQVGLRQHDIVWLNLTAIIVVNLVASKVAARLQLLFYKQVFS
jgi:hypothetical protein